MHITELTRKVIEEALVKKLYAIGPTAHYLKCSENLLRDKIRHYGIIPFIDNVSDHHEKVIKKLESASDTSISLPKGLRL